MQDNIFERAFEKVEEELRPIEYRDALLPPYGDPEKSTATQLKAWKLMDKFEGATDEDGHLKGVLIAIIGAKGSGKTYFGACFASRMMQKFPESIGCVISNTYGQVKDNAIPAFHEVMRNLNLEAEFYSQIKIGGRPYTSVYVVDLGGGKQSYMLVRSFDAVNKLEGVELDWMWVEEIQHSPKDAFITALSRVRGQGADQSVFIAGMTDAAFHWQYKFLPRYGFVEEEIRDEDHNGVMYEPKLKENVQNVGQKYIDGLRRMYSDRMARMLVEAERVSLNSNRVVGSYNDQQHRLSRMAALSSVYDPKRKVYISIDFNVAPMTATLWQEKGWNDEWDAFGTHWDGETFRVTDKYEGDGQGEYPHPAAWRQPNRQILAQIDEFEVYGDGTYIGTPLLMREIWQAEPYQRRFPEQPEKWDDQRYADHYAGFVILGDATGNRDDTRSHTTDWNLIARSVDEYAVKKVTIIRGLQSSSNIKTGEIKYSNPPRRDTINRLNATLRNGEGTIKMCFLPDSPAKSGGAARACAMLAYKPDGKVDDSVDKVDDREQYKTHPFDTVRYMIWHWTGGSSTNADAFNKNINEARTLNGKKEWKTSNKRTGFRF